MTWVGANCKATDQYMNREGVYTPPRVNKTWYQCQRSPLTVTSPFHCWLADPLGDIFPLTSKVHSTDMQPFQSHIDSIACLPKSN
jgi:hypothetical protein